MNALVKWFVGAVACLLACAPVSASAAPGFGQIAGPGGCLLASGTAASPSCGEGKGLFHPKAVAVSPDGSNVYVVGGVAGDNVAQSFGEAVTLKRNAATGEVSDEGCLSSDGTDGRDGASGICTPTPSLLGADGVAVGGDGHSVFVIARSSGSVVAFARDPATGALTRLGCLQTTPRPGSPCTPANLFPGSTDLLTNPSGSALYVASPLEGVISTLLAPPLPATASAGPQVRATTGSGGNGTTSSTSTSSTSTSSTSTVASLFSPMPAGFSANPCIAVNGLDGPCTVGIAMAGVSGLALAPEGKQLYAVSPTSKAVDVFSLAGSGALTESGCLMVDPPAGMCTASKRLLAPAPGVAVSPDGRNVYVADHSARGGGQIDILSRDPTSGGLTDSACVDFLPVPEKHESKEETPDQEKKESEREAKEPEAETKEAEKEPADQCTSGPGLESVESVAISADGSQLYAFGSDSAATFARAPGDGALTETACASESDSRCAAVTDLSGVEAAAVSPDGRNVYAVTANSKALLAFGLGASVTSTTAATSSDLARVAVACPAHLRRPCRGRVALTAAIDRRSGRHAHHKRRRLRRSVRIAAGGSGLFWLPAGGHKTVTVRIYGSARRLLLHHRHLRVTAAVVSAPFAGGSDFGRRLTLRAPARRRV
jgi:sugar lactone lactonase YvrE